MGEQNKDPKRSIKEIPCAYSDSLLVAAYVALSTPQPFYILHKVANDIEKYLIEQKLIIKRDS